LRVSIEIDVLICAIVLKECLIHFTLLFLLLDLLFSTSYGCLVIGVFFIRILIDSVFFVLEK
jgi:hypothetical protein